MSCAGAEVADAAAELVSVDCDCGCAGKLVSEVW